MNELLSMRLKGLAYYRKPTSFTFEPGITCVLGRNQNARHASASNGAGKSSLFIPVHAALGYNAPLIKGRLGGGDIFGKASEGSLVFKRGASVYESLRKGTSFKVTKNGQDLGLRTQSLALERLAKLRGLTETQFYSTVYLDSSKPHLFQGGTSAERFSYFTDLFNLHDVDHIRAEINRLLKDADDAASEYDRAKVEHDAIPDSDTTELEEKYKTMVRRQYRRQQFLQRAASIRQLVHALGQHERQQKEIAEVEARIKHPLGELRAERQALRDRAAAESDREKWETLRKQMLRDIRALQETVGNLSLKEAKAKLDAMSSATKTEKPDEPESDRPDSKTLKKMGLSKDTGPKALAKTLTEKAGALASTVSQQRKFISEVEAHKKDTGTAADACPLCRTKLKPKHFQLLLDDAQKELDAARSELKAIEGFQNALEAEVEHRAYDKSLAEWEANQPKDADQLPDLRKYVRALQRFKDHKEQEPAALKTRKGLGLTEAEVQKQIDLHTKVLALRNGLSMPMDAQDQIQSFARTNSVKAERGPLLAFLDTAEEKAKASLDSCNDLVPRLRSQLDRSKLDADRKAKLAKQMKATFAAAADREVLKHLMTAYSKTGIKNLMIKRYAGVVEQNLNALSNTLLHEPMKFQLVVERQNFHVLVTRRNNRGKPLTSDARTLSGAERRMFIFLSLLASLPLLPSSMRYDTLILDEPDANLDPPNLEALRDRIIPKLLSVVKKVIVLSPNPAIVTPGARVFTAVKKGGDTMLVKGIVK